MTLFQAVTGGVTWQECSEVLEQISPALELAFATYITITCFAVLNVVTGTFCQSAISAAESDPNMIAVNLAMKRKKREELLNRLFEMIDHDESGAISYVEMENTLTDLQVQAGFEALGLEVNDAWMLFKLLDSDLTDMVDIHKFMNG